MVVYLDQDVQYRLEVFQTLDLALQNDDRDPSMMSVIINKDSIKFKVYGPRGLMTKYTQLYLCICLCCICITNIVKKLYHSRAQ